MDDRYIIGTNKDGSVRWASRSEVIQNAIDQEAAGIRPMYRLMDDHGRPWSAPGWLVWSSWDHGCGVVARTASGGWSIMTGPQGDFCISCRDLFGSSPADLREEVRA